MTELRDRLVSRALGEVDELQRWAADRANRPRRSIAQPAGEPDTIRALQRALHLFRGVYRGRATGRFDDRTRAALRRYQEGWLPAWSGSPDPNLADGPSAPLVGYLDWRTLYVLDYQVHELEEAALAAAPGPAPAGRTARNVFRVVRHAENELDVVVDRWADLDQRLYLQLYEVDVLDANDDLGRIDCTIIRRADGACRFCDDLAYAPPASPAPETGDGIVVRLQVESGEWRAFTVPIRGESAAADSGETGGRDRYEVSFTFKQGREGRVLAPPPSAAPDDRRAVPESPWVIHVRPGHPAVPASLAAAFERVRTRMQRVRILADSIQHLLGVHRAVVATHAPTLSVLGALDGLLGGLLERPKAPPSAQQRTDARALRSALSDLRANARLALLLEPPGLRPIRDDVATQARELLRDQLEDEALRADVQLLVANRAAAPTSLWEDTADALERAGRALVETGLAEEFVARHLRPMVRSIASRTRDLSAVVTGTDPLSQAIREASEDSPPAPTSIFEDIVATVGLATMAVGNTPGPASMAVALVQCAGPHIAAHHLSGDPDGPRHLGELFDFLVTTSDLHDHEVELLASAVGAEAGSAESGGLGAMRQIDWAARLHVSPRWGAAVGVASLIVLLATLSSSDRLENPARWFANALSSGTGVALGAAQALQAFERAREIGLIAELATGPSGQVLGCAGCVFAMIAATASVIEARDTRDATGEALGWASVSSSGMSVAGFLIMASVFADATVVGVPLGVALMAAGVIVGLGAGVWSTWRSATMTGSRLVFEGFVDQFRATGTWLQGVHETPSLAGRLDRVLAAEHIDLWDADPALVPQLLDLGFDGDTVAVLIDESITVVQARAEGRVTSSGRA